MKRGTPGFNGDRLREAREVRGLTIRGLAEIAEVSPQAVSQYEHARTSPTPEVVSRMAIRLNVPVTFFLLPSREPDHGAIFYRSMSSATLGARSRAEHRIEWLDDIVQYVSQFVSLPEPNLPDFKFPKNVQQISDQEIEDAAARTRDFWGIKDGPISNMVRLLENHGVIVARDHFNAQSLDSLSKRVGVNQRPLVLIGVDKGTPARWRFDAAHELGHLVLHSHLDPNAPVTSEVHTLKENQAHRFSAAFLLPIGPFADDLYAANLDAFKSLKTTWKVSISMMIVRAFQADLIREDTYKRLQIALSRKKWRSSEPFDDTMEIEEPRLLRRAFELILDDGVHTPDDVLEELQLPAHDVELLSGMPPRYLTSYAPVSLRAETRRRETRDIEHSAEIIQMPTRNND